MIRHLADLTPQVQVWGCDIWADAVIWCEENLSPPFWFATTTVVPHLPFADDSFGLVYCGSLFTHMDDLADAWFLELYRIIRPGGRLLFSVNDRHAVKVFDGDGDPTAYPRYWERTGGRQVWESFTQTMPRIRLPAVPKWGCLDGVHGQRRDGACDVGYRRAVSTSRLWLEVLLGQPRVYGHQTFVLLERA